MVWVPLSALWVSTFRRHAIREVIPLRGPGCEISGNYFSTSCVFGEERRGSSLGKHERTLPWPRLG